MSLPATLGALAGDVLSVAGIPTALANRSLDAVLRKRVGQARDILLDELRHGEKTLSSDDVEEGVAILYRYVRAAHEGTARLNLRLMAKVIAGQVRTNAVRAESFLFYADHLAGLRRAEILYLGCLYRHWTAPRLRHREDEHDRANEAQRLAMEELVPHVFADVDEFAAATAATVRTGLLIGTATYGGTIYRPTRVLLDLGDLAPFEAAVGQETA